MILQEFIKKHEGNFVDFDGAYGNQCVDLVRTWIKENGWVQLPKLGNNTADKWWTMQIPDFYEKVENSDTNIPSPGDILVWESGHTAIFEEGSVTKFVSFDQNYPIGSRSHRQEHKYTGLLGWFTPTKKDNLYKGLDLNNPKSMMEAVDVWYDVMHTKTYIKYEEHINRISETIATKNTECQRLLKEQKDALSSEIQIVTEPKEIEKIVEKIVEKEKPIEEISTSYFVSAKFNHYTKKYKEAFKKMLERLWT